jgi:N-formylglutamate deformylase
MNPVSVIQGSSPIILGQPHSGQYVPEAIWANLNALGRQLLDTDWHIPELYEGLLKDVTIVKANFSRYVIDANRDPKGTSLYPGQNTTDLVPLSSFDNSPIWDTPPSAADIELRIEQFHRVYHKHLQSEIERLKVIHGQVFLYDCHSIRSKIPFLFDAQLPDLNMGDNSGKSCNTKITKVIEQVCARFPNYSHVVNGRFKGGWTTRHYGHPDDNVNAFQMELAQHRYLESEKPPFVYSPFKANELRKVLQKILHEINHLMSTTL